MLALFQIWCTLLVIFILAVINIRIHYKGFEPPEWIQLTFGSFVATFMIYSTIISLFWIWSW